MRTIAVVSRKGGSGKTTVAVQLAIGLWLRGRRTLLADTDPQHSSLEVLRNRHGDGPDAVMSAGAKLFTLQAGAVRDGVDALIIDTPAVVEEETAQAIVLADLAVMVLRPTFLDLAAAVHTSRLIRQLRKPGLLILNQAPVARGAVEPPAVKRTLEALQLLRLPVAPAMLRSRAIFQTAMEHGRSAEELEPDGPAGRETAQMCEFLQRFTFGEARAQSGGAQG
ncbi:ParA family protein [soil metagenome]